MARPTHRLWRLTVVLALVPVALNLAAEAAAAHPSGSNPDAAFYRTDLAEVVPALPELTVRVDPSGDWLELTNSGRAVVVVLGYTGEPYLRVTATDIAENRQSQTTYLNKSMFADIPTGAGTAGVAPSWQPIAGAGTVRWHDHRIHWMGQARPPEVAADPAHRHLLGTWVVHAISGSLPVDIRGRLSWIGKPTNPPLRTWLIVVLGNLPFVIGAVVWKLRRSPRGRSQPTLEPTTV